MLIPATSYSYYPVALVPVICFPSAVQAPPPQSLSDSTTPSVVPTLGQPLLPTPHPALKLPQCSTFVPPRFPPLSPPACHAAMRRLLPPPGARPHRPQRQQQQEALCQHRFMPQGGGRLLYMFMTGKVDVDARGLVREAGMALSRCASVVLLLMSARGAEGKGYRGG